VWQKTTGTPVIGRRGFMLPSDKSAWTTSAAIQSRNGCAQGCIVFAVWLFIFNLFSSNISILLLHFGCLFLCLARKSKSDHDDRRGKEEKKEDAEVKMIIIWFLFMYCLTSHAVCVVL
jgi:hypothetical protein